MRFVSLHESFDVLSQELSTTVSGVALEPHIRFHICDHGLVRLALGPWLVLSATRKERLASLELRRGAVSAALCAGTSTPLHCRVDAHADLHATTRLGAAWDSARPGEGLVSLRHTRAEGWMDGCYVHGELHLSPADGACGPYSLLLGREFAVGGAKDEAALV